MTPTIATPDATPTTGLDGTPTTCPRCEGDVVHVQGLLACHDCDWTRGGR
ncbi:MAG: hypothetical protein ABEJ61_04825 [Haloferacaceae archaeon]